MHLFYDHVNDKLQESVTSIISKNLEDKEIIKTTKNLDLEKIQSFYASDIFRSLFNVVELLCGDIKGHLLFQIIKIVIDKMQEIQKVNDNYLSALNKTEELVVSCVYVLDAHNCVEIFPDFKKKIKNILQKEFYDRLKVYYRNTTSLFNNTIRIGCLKAIELMFIEMEHKFLSKILTTEWNEDVLTGIFESFKTYFNRGFVKILKHQHILIIIIRSFIDNFVNCYVEELIHSLRSLNRKKLGESPLSEYKLKYLKLSPDDIKYEAKKEDKLYQSENINSASPNKINKSKTFVKKLDKYDVTNLNKKDENVKFKKYDFPVKKFNKESKEYNPSVVFKKIVEDMKIFKDFLDEFKEDAKEPFSKKLTLTLGNNFIELYIRKFLAIKDILNCTQKSIPDTIKLVFKDSYTGIEGKVLLEALLYAREDNKATTKPDLKKYYLNSYDNDNS